VQGTVQDNFVAIPEAGNLEDLLGIVVDYHQQVLLDLGLQTKKQISRKV